MSFDAKSDTPAAATAVAATDRFVFGDVSADGWDTILAQNVLDALIRLSAGSYYAYASSQHTVKDGAGGLGEFISDKLIVRQDGGVAGTDELQIYHDGTNGHMIPLTGSITIGTEAGNSAWVKVTPGEGAHGQVVIGNSVGHTLHLSTSTLDINHNNNVHARFNMGAARGTESGLSLGGTLAYYPYTLAEITSNQNDYGPTGSGSVFLRMSSDASRDISGMVAPSSQCSGSFKLLVNSGSQNLVFLHQSASSAAANRFICPAAANVTLAPDEILQMLYDGVTARWRIWKS